MSELEQRLQVIDWSRAAESLDERGFAVVPDLLTDRECDELKDSFKRDEPFRKVVNMAAHNFGRGEYRYFDYPLPGVVQSLREAFYPELAAVANRWFDALQRDERWPVEYREFLEQCHGAGQTKATPLLLRYGAGDYNRLHQDRYGELYFPFQLIVLLSEPETDFIGGQLVLVENYPRMQSRPHTPVLAKGSAVIIPTQERPIPSRRGPRRATMRHGVGEILSGTRFTLGVIFHDG